MGVGGRGPSGWAGAVQKEIPFSEPESERARLVRGRARPGRGQAGPGPARNLKALDLLDLLDLMDLMDPLDLTDLQYGGGGGSSPWSARGRFSDSGSTPNWKTNHFVNQKMPSESLKKHW